MHEEEEEMEVIINPENMFVTKGLITTLFQNKNNVLKALLIPFLY
jgi:hypothetical protein